MLHALRIVLLSYVYSGDFQNFSLYPHFQSSVTVDRHRNNLLPARFGMNIVTPMDTFHNPAILPEKLQHLLASQSLHTGTS